MSGNIIQLNEDLIKNNLKDLVRNSVEETFVPQSNSVISSTRRTDTPARYISIRASSTEHSRRL